MSELHKAALDYLARGYEIIPCHPGTKTPMWPDWRNIKLDTVEKIDALFAQFPDLNIAFEPEDMGLAIIDADTYHDGCNVEALNLPPTFEIETPRGGGTHFYFAGSVPPSVGDPDKPDKGLGPYLDTRGRGSYALLPPSVVDGKLYRVKADRPIAVLPLEIEERLAPRREPATAAEHRQDLPGNVEAGRSRLRTLVSMGRLAIEGERGHDTCYEVACELVRDLGLSQETALEVRC